MPAGSRKPTLRRNREPQIITVIQARLLQKRSLLQLMVIPAKAGIQYAERFGQIKTALEYRVARFRGV
ncbi:hypothetical protein [Bradyrhizobium sp.]|uniref:hypothetical protein n=1 Tax=Bradyrhizobium sp. TaxID=376 RepID=UPI002620F844|nr:hypothetical protein [Bradyrhizobium sp.]